MKDDSGNEIVIIQGNEACVMGAIYRRLLDELQRRGFPIGGPRVRLSSATKLAIAARALLWGARLA